MFCPVFGGEENTLLLSGEKRIIIGMQGGVMADSEERKPGIDSGTGTAPAAEATGTPADESGADAAPATEATGAPADESGADAAVSYTHLRAHET